MKNEIYVAHYSKSDYNIPVFASTNKSKVTKWCTKFNNLLKNLNEEIVPYLEYNGIVWIKEDAPKWAYNRFFKLNNVDNAFWREIEIR